MSNPEATTAAIAERARLAIRDSGLAQRQISHRIGLDETKLSKSLSGARRFSAQELMEIATVTGATAHWLLSGSHAAEDSSVTATPQPQTLPSQHSEPAEALRRRTIVENAWWLFAESGYDDARVCDIAHAAGVSTATIHYYFPTKREIFSETLRYSVKLAFDRQSAALGEIDDPAERLRTLVRLQLPTDRQRRAEWSIWLQTWSTVAVSSAQHTGYPESYSRWWRTVRGIIAEGQHSGAFSAGALEERVDLFTALVDGLGTRIMTGLIPVARALEQIDAYISDQLLTRSKREDSTYSVNVKRKVGTPQ